MIFRFDRRRLAWTSVTMNPTAEWIRDRSPRRFLGTQRIDASPTITIAHMASSSHESFARSVSGIDSSRRAPWQKMATLSGLGAHRPACHDQEPDPRPGARLRSSAAARAQSHLCGEGQGCRRRDCRSLGRPSGADGGARRDARSDRCDQS